MRSIASKKLKRRGQSMAELALLLPVLAMGLLSLVDFGLVLYAHIQVANAAREAARAASLYRQTRYLYNIRDSGGKLVVKSCSGNGSSTIDGWTLDQTIAEAVVTHERDNDGCPKSTGTIIATSLGRLDPKPATADMWTVSVTPPQNGSDMPTAGITATVTLNYKYRLLILSNFIPALTDPVTISKSVVFEYQK